jgi:RNA polymerase sigma-70 factor (ECF subfamily)
MRELNREGYLPVAISDAKAIAGGDAATFELIYRSYCELVRRIGVRILRSSIDAEDVTQDVFLKVLQKVHTFRGEAAFSSWLYRVATNLTLARLRQRKNHLPSVREIQHPDKGIPIESGKPDMQLKGLLDRMELEAAIDLLPAGYKAAFVLHEIQGYEHKEIARIFGCSVANSKSQLHKARKRLRGYLAKGCKSGHIGHASLRSRSRRLHPNCSSLAACA